MKLLYNIDFSITALLITGILLIFHCAQYNTKSYINRRYRTVACLLLLTDGLDILVAVLMSCTNKIPVSVISGLNTLFFISSAAVACQLSNYVVDYVATGKKRQQLLLVNNVYFVLYTVSILANIRGRFYFWFDTDGTYYHGPVHIISCLLPIYFILSAMILVLIYKKSLEKRVILSMAGVMVLVAIGDFLQIFIFPYTLLNSFMQSLGMMLLLFSMETPDYQNLIKTMDELETSRKEAEVANRTKSDFLARMSHEIRTPINTILGMNEMILRESTEPDVKKYANDIKSAAALLLTIINEILDSSKIESGKMEIVPGNYEIASMLHDLYSMISMKAEEKGLQLIFDADPSIPMAYFGDDVRIRQVLMNLLTNSVKYTQTGTVRLKVTADVNQDRAILHFLVADTGIGIKKEDIEKLFTKYERVDMAHNRYVEGTGLGMNITMQLLKLMGSELCVTSEYGKGSVFSFHIYQKVVNPEPLGNFQFKAALASSEQPYESAYTAPEAKILVVDDNEMNLEVFRCLLKKTKMQIREAASGRECLKLLETEQFHIIFLDHMMPEMDGIETFHIMKQRSLCPNTPVIMLTANAISGAREQYLNEGFHDFLAKPVLLNKLDTLILKYLPKELVKFDSSKEETPVLTDKEAKFLQALPITEGFDFDHAMNLLGSKEILAHVLSEFYEYLPRALDKLTQYMDTLSKPQTLPLYRAEIHTLKDSANTVGASVIFRLARLLEEAAEENNMEKIQKLHPILIESMSKCRNRLSAILLCSQEQS